MKVSYKKINYLKNILDKIIEHYIIAILTTLFSVSGILEFCTKYKPIKNFALPFFRWYWTPWIILVIILICILFHFLFKKFAKEKQDRQIKSPKYFASVDQRFVNREYENVIWKAMIGSDAGPAMSNEIDEYNVRVWVKKNPYCPECDFELERARGKWRCIPCSKNYIIPRKLRKDTLVKITKIFQRYRFRLAPKNWMVHEKPQIPIQKYIKNSQKKSYIKFIEN